MVALWKKMRESFGGTWTREYGDIDGEAIWLWQRSLAMFTPNQLARGIKSAQEWTGRFPPNLPQFKDLCLTMRPEEIKPFKSEIKQLSDFTKRKRGDSETAKREKARIARILAGEEVETREESMHNLGLNRRWGA